MQISLENHDISGKNWKGWHILLVAEDGFSMLDIYGRQNGLDRKTIRKFADKVNELDDMGTLFPQRNPLPVDWQAQRDIITNFE